ncbi:MAG: hypothetical protein IJA86_00890 [Clostridia bacterium]|nr:hypothetical protein [Clostridia bacterium]
MIHTLLLGLGGTGSRVVNKVAKDLRNNRIPINDGLVCCAVMDTNTLDNEALLKSRTNIPVIATSSEQTVGDLLRKYEELKEWCVDDVGSFLSESMTDGASAMRMKSRLAFLDTYRGMKIKTIDDMISQMITSDDGKGTNIRVMIVSSISGGTGAGMFLQTALWIRDMFKRRDKEIKLRGILLLPDVFVKTLESIGNNKFFVQRHYANAYAAVREMNAVTRIKMDPNYKPRIPMKIDELFDSEKKLDHEADSRKGVFDFLFFVDYQNEAGANLSSVSAYEDLAAQLAYMQLFSPIDKDMCSQEDNLFLPALQNPGLNFGSCGTSKAVYPRDEVMEYCILNAASDMVNGGWRQLDSEIEAAKRNEKAREEAGENVRFRIDPVEKYVQLFEEKVNKSGDSVGKNRFFVSLKEESSVTKVETFFNNLDNKIVAKVAETNSNKKGFGKLNALGVGLEADLAEPTKEEVAEYSIDDLQATIETNKTIVDKTIHQFDESDIFVLSDNIINEVFPCIMGDLNMHNMNSVYGMLTQLDKKTGIRSFVHPVSMRYLLYKLQAEIEKQKNEMEGLIDTARANIMTGTAEGKELVSFDYGRTKDKETLETYFRKIPGFFQGGEDPFKLYFIKTYRSYIQGQFAAGKSYEFTVLKYEVLKEVAKRVGTLVKNLENFFSELPSISEACATATAQNLKKTGVTTNSVAYVCANEKAKKYIYNSLDLDFGGSDKTTNRTVIDAVYGMLCAKMIPDHDDNKKYANFNIKQAFMDGVRSFYTKKISETCADKIDLDIYQALKIEHLSEMDQEEPVASGNDVFWNADEKPLYSAEETEYITKMNNLISKLKHNASPFMNYDNCGQIIYTFWGFNSSLIKSCPALANNPALGNVETQSDNAYPKNELCCYTSVYGIDTDHFSKFRETEDGLYYKRYREIVDAMDAKQTYTLMQTPHLDKTWHNTLPYLSMTKQAEYDKRFCEAILHGFAYDRLRIEGDGYQIRRGTNKWETICEGNYAIRKADVAGLVKFLLRDSVFISEDINILRERFKEDIANLSDYVGTKIYKYLLTEEDENPIKLIVSYSTCKDSCDDITEGMIKAIEDIMLQLIEAYDSKRYDMNRSDTSKTKAQTERLRQIYEACDCRGKENIFVAWTDRF